MRKRDEKGRFISETEDLDQPVSGSEPLMESGYAVCYKSNVLNKYFDNLEDLVKAEEEYNKKSSEKLRLVEVKKERAQEIENAYKELQEVKRKAIKEINEAENHYIELRDKFIKDYKSYHMSYYNDGNKSEVTISDLVDSVFSIFNF